MKRQRLIQMRLHAPRPALPIRAGPRDGRYESKTRKLALQFFEFVAIKQAMVMPDAKQKRDPRLGFRQMIEQHGAERRDARARGDEYSPAPRMPQREISQRFVDIDLIPRFQIEE